MKTKPQYNHIFRSNYGKTLLTRMENQKSKDKKTSQQKKITNKGETEMKNTTGPSTAPVNSGKTEVPHKEAENSTVFDRDRLRVLVDKLTVYTQNKFAPLENAPEDIDMMDNVLKKLKEKQIERPNSPQTGSSTNTETGASTNIKPGSSTKTQELGSSTTNSAPGASTTTDEPERMETQAIKKERPPPIHLTAIISNEFRTLLQEIKRITHDFHVQQRHGKEETVIFFHQLHHYKQFVDQYGKVLPFYTYSTKSEKTYTYVVKGLTAGVNSEDLEAELTELGIPCKRAYAMKNTRFPTYMVTLHRHAKMEDLNRN